MKALQYKILLIEDDEDDYYLTKDVFDSVEKVKYDIEWCETFEKGLEMIQSQEFDVALVDYRIGGKTGIEFVVSAKNASVGVPMILLTGLQDREIDLAASEAGAYYYLNKDELSPALVERTIRFACAAAMTQRSLAEQSALLQATLDNAGAGIAAVDGSGEIVARNKKFVEYIHSLFPECCEGTTTQTAPSHVGEFRVSDLTQLLKHIRVANDDKGEVQSEDSRTFKLSADSTEENGNVIIVSDITEQKEYERNLEKAKDEAESASRAKTTFLTTMSHELRTPLNAIIGFSELVMNTGREDMDPSQHHEYMSYICESGHNLLRIINEILEFAKTDVSQRELDKQVLNVQNELDYCIRLLMHEAEKQNIDVCTSIAQTDQYVLADVTAFRRIVTNIMSNAIKFTPANGVVSISSRITSRGTLQILITDTGVGIPEEELELVTQPFYQVRSDINRQFEGTGLGLSVAASLAQLHEASVTINSTPDQGTAVMVEFPAKYVVDGDHDEIPNTRKSYAAAAK